MKHSIQLDKSDLAEAIRKHAGLAVGAVITFSADVDSASGQITELSASAVGEAVASSEAQETKQPETVSIQVG